MLKLHKPPKR